MTSPGDFLISRAARAGLIPLIGLVGESGGGKTLTGLFLARGFVGPVGKVGCIDTENKRALHFADQVEFDHLSLTPPFTPDRYAQALTQFESAGYSAVVLDSMTHEWSGEGGYLHLKEQEIDRMAGDDWKKREKCALAAAARLKPKTHDRLVQQILRSNMMIVLCFRGKQKVRMGKDASGRTTITQDEHISPIQDSGLIFECLIAGEVFAREQELQGVQTRVGGYFRCTKHTVASLLPLLPKDGEQLGAKHGEALAKWCSASASNPNPNPNPTLSLKKELWELTKPKHNGDIKALEHWLLSENLITDTETLADLTPKRISDVLAGVKGKLVTP